MKKWLCWGLAALMSLSFSGALAAEVDFGEDAFGDALRLETNEPYSIDLDGDGVEETVQVNLIDPDNGDCLKLLVETQELIYEFPTYICSGEEAFSVDLDGDAVPEILLCGDEASADFYTCCLKFDPEHGFEALPFANADRGDITEPYQDFGYGRIDAIRGATLIMTGSQDALGTWWCSREFTLRDGRFELDDDGIWHVVEDFSDPDIWEYRALTPIRDLPVTLEDGAPGVLTSADRFLVTETDRVSYVGFLTESGVRGTIAVTPNEEDGWGFLIDGVSENEYFDYIPYAD